jgi:hypothetical protein
MGIADSYGKSVSGIMGFWRSGEAQQGLNHFLHLLLGSVPAPHHGFLHLTGTVFMNSQPGLRPGKDHHSPHLAYRFQALHIFSVKYILDCQDIRPRFLYQFLNEIVYAAELFRQIFPLAGAAYTAGNHAGYVSSAVQHTETNHFTAGIDTQDSFTGI